MKEPQIHGINEIPGATDTVVSWIVTTWAAHQNGAATEIRCRVEGRCNNPMALVATLDGVPVGAAAFRRFDVPGGERDALWIDALYVSENHRRHGIGSQLILAAERVASRTDERLYVLTEIPKIYTAQGWFPVQRDGETANWICMKALPSLSPHKTPSAPA